VNSPLAGDDGDARSRGALGESISPAGAGSTPASLCGAGGTAGAGAAVSGGGSAGWSKTGAAPVGALSVSPTVACSPDDARLAPNPSRRRSSARRSERRGVRRRERAARGVRPRERAARRLLPDVRRPAARGRWRRSRVGAPPSGLGLGPGAMYVPSRAVAAGSSGSGAAASSPQLRPSVAISVPAASSAASLPTFPHRTRRTSAGAPRAHRRSIPRVGVHPARFAPRRTSVRPRRARSSLLSCPAPWLGPTT
jgi:hypothetical protein